MIQSIPLVLCNMKFQNTERNPCIVLVLSAFLIQVQYMVMVSGFPSKTNEQEIPATIISDKNISRYNPENESGILARQMTGTGYSLKKFGRYFNKSIRNNNDRRFFEEMFEAIGKTGLNPSLTPRPPDTLEDSFHSFGLDVAEEVFTYFKRNSNSTNIPLSTTLTNETSKLISSTTKTQTKPKSIISSLLNIRHQVVSTVATTEVSGSKSCLASSQ